MTTPAPVGKPSFAERARKFLVAAAGVLTMVLATKGLEEDVEVWVNALLGVITAVLVYMVPNKPAVNDPNLRA